VIDTEKLAAIRAIIDDIHDDSEIDGYWLYLDIQSILNPET
jgi:hypothetical protein